MTKELIVSSTSHEASVALLEDDQLVELYIARGAQHGLAGSIYKGRVTRVLPGMQSAFVNIGLDRDAFLYVSDFVGEMEDLDEASIDPDSAQAISKGPRPVAVVMTPAREDESAAGEEPAEADERPQGAREAQRPASQRGESQRESQRGDSRGEQQYRGGQRRDQQRGNDSQRGNEPQRVSGTERPGESGREGAQDREPGQERDGRRDRRGRRYRRRRGRGTQFPDAKYAQIQGSEQGRPDASEPRAEGRRPANESPEETSKPVSAREEELEFTVLPGESLAKYSGPARAGHSEAEADEADQFEAEGADWNDDAEALKRPEPSYGDDEPEEEIGRRGISEEVSIRVEVRHRRETADFDRDGATVVVEESEIIEEESFGENEEDAVPEAVARVLADDAEDEGDESVDGAARELPSLAADRDADEATDEDEEGLAGEMALDASEAAEMRAAIREAMGDAESEELEAGEEEEDGEEGTDEGAEDERTEDEAGDFKPESGDGEQQPPAAAGKETEEGARQAQLRGRSGSSRYVHRRGGRRGRRRGRPRGGPQPQEQEVEAVEAESRPAAHTSITELLQPGQEILVQISKEPLGKKGARITSHIAMPGRYLVYMPTVDHVGVSRKIATDGERLRLRKIVQTHRTGMTGGFIVRTAGEGASEEEIRGDMMFLYNLWLDIRQKAEQRPAPSLIHQDLEVVERVLRDQLGSDFKTMWVDSEAEYERILRFVERFQPALLSRVKLYTRSKPIFDSFNITPEIEKALRPKVWLKSGGYIVINQTEALVAIDVNTGKFVGKSDRLEDTIVKTNLEAVQEIVRQVRLRDLGGIIVVDFIDMDDRKNRTKVMQALDQELRLDRAPSKSLMFNEFGLVAITRKRVKQSLERTLCTACPYCTGSGFVKSIDTVVYEILSEAKKMAPRVRAKKDLTIRVNPEIAKALKSRENSFLQEIEEIFRANVLVRGDVSLHREHFDIN